MGGSHFSLVNNLDGGRVPQVDPELAKRTFARLHDAIKQGVVCSCHDLSEGGLAVAAAEMAFAGGVGVEIDVTRTPVGSESLTTTSRLFSESNTRFLCEVTPEHAAAFESTLSDVANAKIGDTNASNRLKFIESSHQKTLIDAELAELKAAWQDPAELLIWLNPRFSFSVPLAPTAKSRQRMRSSKQAVKRRIFT